jgi:sortase (surface protein transpeptidase)
VTAITRGRRAAQPSIALPLWLRGKPAQKARRQPLTPRDLRWWIGVVCVALSVTLLGFVGHVTLFGALQEANSQQAEYGALRQTLALATTPTGQLDLNHNLVADGTPIAVLTIPKLGLKQVIAQGTTSQVLRSGPGHRADSVLPGQAGTSVVFGRQSTYGGPFGGLAALVPGDTITVMTGQGTSTFTVLGLRRPGDLLPETLGANQGRLELVTADGPILAPSGTLYVDASLKGTAKPTPRQVLGVQALEDGSSPMQPDPNALLPFLFSLQWLIVAVALTRWLLARWGRWQTWIICFPVILVLAATTADAAMGLLPNLL